MYFPSSQILISKESHYMKIAVLLTVFNRKEKTIRCLRNLYSQAVPLNYSIEVYLTDDGCTDGTPEAIITEFPNVNIISGDGSLFWNRGMYAAWSEAEKKDYDFFLWLNDDTFLFENCIINLLKESEIYNHNAIIIGSTVDSKREKVTYGGWFKNKIINPQTENREADTFNGNIVLIPRSVYNILGKNDPYFRHAMGDTDYGLRAKKTRLKNIVCSEICGICDDHPRKPKWKDPDVSLKERCKALYSTGGNGSNPFEFFYFKKRHFGILKACISFITNHVHVLFPQLWK